MKTEPMLPVPAPVRWSTWALLAGLLLLVIASFATLPLKWGEFFSADAVRTTKPMTTEPRIAHSQR